MIAWHQGLYIEDRVALHLAGGAFRCGLGVFETILARGGAPLGLGRHLARLAVSLDALGIAHQGLNLEETHGHIVEVVRRNGLETARVNIFRYQDQPESPAATLITAAPYAVVSRAARRLTVYPQVQASYLSAHKTMANLHPRLAWEYARQRGFDDAVLAGPSAAGGQAGKPSMVLECATAALLFSDGQRFFTPATPFKLPSLALEAACGVLPVQECSIVLGDLGRFRHAYALNSLIGIQPVLQIDDVTYDEDFAACAAVARARETVGETVEETGEG